MWATVKPNQPGVYKVRGFQVGITVNQQREAVVEVAARGAELVCNLHAVNSCALDDEFAWMPLSNMSCKFEWQGPLTVNGASNG